MSLHEGIKIHSMLSSNKLHNSFALKGGYVIIVTFQMLAFHMI